MGRLEQEKEIKAEKIAALKSVLSRIENNEISLINIYMKRNIVEKATSEPFWKEFEPSAFFTVILEMVDKEVFEHG